MYGLEMNDKFYRVCSLTLGIALTMKAERQREREREGRKEGVCLH